jgi:putative ABC transport system permease protein
VRHALRALRKTPGFTAVVVTTLAVGLGMNTAVFSIVNAVMLRSLPYRPPDRLVSLWEEATKRQEMAKLNSSGRDLGGAGSRQRATVAPANLVDYRKGTSAFEELAGVEITQMNLTGNGSPERLPGERVTAGYFSALGVTPEIGRTFTAEEDRPEAYAAVIVSHDFWQRRLGGDTAVLGQLDAVSTALEKQYPDTNPGMRARLSPLRDDLV